VVTEHTSAAEIGRELRNALRRSNAKI
jgi:hypothetical protein